VSEHAFAAAFRDHRFPPLSREELADLSLSVSVLSAPSPMTFAGERDLLAQLRPHVDGLIIEDAGHRALFLPAVWETLPEAESFLGHLKVKAGLSAGHWSDRFMAWRFVAEEVSGDDLPDPSALWSPPDGG
jgi:AmmeMemoRadiSam system protein A